jgi:hypothetical protein
MGWHTNYEVIFDEYFEWDDYIVKMALPDTCTHIYLRDLESTPRAILCIYSQSSIEEILTILTAIYPFGVRYRTYGSADWIHFGGK